MRKIQNKGIMDIECAPGYDRERNGGCDMGLLNHFVKTIKATGTAEMNVKGIGKDTEKDIVLVSSSHTVEDIVYGDGDSEYRISFKVNNAFKEAKSHAGEVEMLYTYAPEDEYGAEGTFPYLAIQNDDAVYSAVEEFKASGTVTDALDMTKLSGKFYFKAKIKYYDYIMYFYGMDRCDGYWENSGLCMVYPKAYAGTENETKLMKVLDEAAESYCEEITP